MRDVLLWIFVAVLVLGGLSAKDILARNDARRKRRYLISTKTPVVFPVGTAVAVVPSSRHSTSHHGTIREIIWHYQESRWNYYIEVSGRKIATRYLEEDLRRVSGLASHEKGA